MNAATLTDLTQVATPTQLPLVQIADTLFEFAGIILERGENLGPMIHMLTPKGHTVGNLGPLFNRTFDKFKGPAIRAMLNDLKASAYVLACEGWTLPRDAREGYARNGRHPLREDDRRISVLSLTGENRKGDTLLGVWFIRMIGEKRRLIEPADTLWLLSESEQGGQPERRMMGLMR